MLFQIMALNFMAYKMGILPTYKGVFLRESVGIYFFGSSLEVEASHPPNLPSERSAIIPRYSKVEPKKLINIKAFSLDRVLEMDPEFMDTETWRS